MTWATLAQYIKEMSDEHRELDVVVSDEKYGDVYPVDSIFLDNGIPEYPTYVLIVNPKIE